MAALKLTLIVAALTACSAYVPLCVFDLDHTLTHSSFTSASSCGVSKFPSDGIAVYGIQGVQACVDRGYSIAIASAEAGITVDILGKKSFLSKVNSMFTPEYLKTPAFQYGTSDKSVELKNLISYFNVPPNCVIFYDDASKNEQYAKDVGVNFSRASRSCNGNELCLSACGLSKTEFEEGLVLLENACPLM